jgi:hypothetical protein
MGLDLGSTLESIPVHYFCKWDLNLHESSIWSLKIRRNDVNFVSEAINFRLTEVDIATRTTSSKFYSDEDITKKQASGGYSATFRQEIDPKARQITIYAQNLVNPVASTFMITLSGLPI